MSSRKSRRTSRKSRKSSHKERRTSRKSRKSSHKERRTSRKERRTSRKSRKSSHKERTSRKERRTSRKSRKSSHKERTSRKERNDYPIIQQIQKPIKIQPIPPQISYTNGLIINNNRIASISGPVSFYYLRPKKEVYNDGNGKYFPLIVLFGDSHRSEENYCSPCTCSLQTKDCCYKLSDPSFLRSIDSMCNYGYTIDFYTETFFEGTGLGFKGGMMEEMTTGNIVTCYNRQLRNTRLDRCPTKNIRWQAGDVRQAGVDLRIFSGDRVMKFTNSIKYLKNSYIEFQIDFIFVLIKGYFTYPNKNFYRYQISKTLPKTYFKNIQGFKNFLMNLVDGDNFNFKKFSGILFSMMNKDNSAIYKQVKKQTYRNFNDIRQWEDFFARSLEQCDIKVSTSPYSLKDTITKLDRYINDQLQISPIGLNDIRSLWLYITSGLVDMYTIARIFKQPTGGNRSDLSFCYFGNAHIINIKRMLLSIGAYELVISKDKKELDDRKPSRCLNFTDIKLNLVDELQNHKLNI